MLKSDFETSTIHNKSVASKTTVSQVHLLSDLKKTSLQKAIERQLTIYKEREQPSISQNKKQIASVLFTGIFQKQQVLEYSKVNNEGTEDGAKDSLALPVDSDFKPGSVSTKKAALQTVNRTHIQNRSNSTFDPDEFVRLLASENLTIQAPGQSKPRLCNEIGSSRDLIHSDVSHSVFLEHHNSLNKTYFDASVDVPIDLSRLKSHCGKFVYHTSIVEYLGEDNQQAIVPHLNKATAFCQKK